MKFLFSSKIFISCALLSSSFCHAWFFLPSSRDVAVATVASLGTLALLHNHYLGQERRLNATINTTSATLCEKTKELEKTVVTGGQQIMDTITCDGQKTREEISELSASSSNDHTGLAQLLLINNQAQAQILDQLNRIENSIAPQTIVVEPAIKPQAKQLAIKAPLIKVFDSKKTPTLLFVLEKMSPCQKPLLISSTHYEKKEITQAIMPKLIATGLIEQTESSFSFAHVTKMASTVGHFLWKSDYSTSEN